MGALYNEIAAYPAAWLRNLIAADHVARGAVDERSIRELAAADLAGVSQFHAFAGIGAWSYALRCAGVSDNARVWTGSCPCQPFSGAGKRRGAADDRHLWPDWFRLIRECRPALVFGEQVGGPDGLAWLDVVCDDLEGSGYAVAAAVLPAAGVGAPHGRHRIYFVANANEHGHEPDLPAGSSDGTRDPRAPGRGRVGNDGADADGLRARNGGSGTARAAPGEVGGDLRERERVRSDVGERGNAGRAGSDAAHRDSGAGRAGRGGRGPSDGRKPSNPNVTRPQRHGGDGTHRDQFRWLTPEQGRSLAATGATREFWGSAEWWVGRDGMARPIGPGLFPLVDGAPARVGRLRAYGNAIVPPLATEFIHAALEALAERKGKTVEHLLALLAEWASP